MLRLALPLASAAAGLSWAVVTTDELPGERRVLERTASWTALQGGAELVDAVTGYLPVGVVTSLLVVGLLFRRRAVEALVAAVAVFGAVAGNTVLKELVQRPRPDVVPLEDVSRYTFPSGHTTATAALAATAVLLVSGTRWFLAVLATGSALVVLAAAAQLLLAQHYPSDVVAGWLWALAWVTAVWGLGSPRGGARHRQRAGR